MLKTLFRKILNIFLTALVLIYLILDELIWERIAEPIYKFLHGLKILHKLEIAIAGLNRYAVLVLFLVLFVAVEGLGIVSIGLFAQGLIVPATILYAGKIPITAFTFWMFKITQDKLLTFGWFKMCYEWLLSVIHKIKTSKAYLNIKTKTVNIKNWLKSHWISKTIQRIKTAFGF
jgi:hypothetical protein